MVLVIKGPFKNFTSKKQIVSHTINNSYANNLLEKYNVGNIIRLNKQGINITFNITKKQIKNKKVVLYFDNELNEELLENRRNWTILK